MKPSRQLLQTRVFILIAPNFDEETVVSCLCRLSDNHISAKIVGTTSHKLTGVHGLTIYPHHSLSQLEAILSTHHEPYLLILPGNHTCATTLLMDPRVHNIVKSTLNGCGGLVASMSPAVQQILHDSGALNAVDVNRFLAQGNISTQEFLHNIITHLADWQPIM